MSAPNTYDPGDGTTITAEFRNGSDVLTDPTTITFQIRRGEDAIEEYVYGTDAEVVRDAAGQYHLDYVLPAEGRWHYRAVGTGAVSAAAEGVLVVRNSAFV